MGETGLVEDLRKKESHRKIAIRTIQGAKIPETTAERDRNQVVKGENVECDRAWQGAKEAMRRQRERERVNKPFF